VTTPIAADPTVHQTGEDKKQKIETNMKAESELETAQGDILVTTGTAKAGGQVFVPDQVLEYHRVVRGEAFINEARAKAKQAETQRREDAYPGLGLTGDPEADHRIIVNHLAFEQAKKELGETEGEKTDRERRAQAEKVAAKQSKANTARAKKSTKKVKAAKAKANA
jgi:hypothetical protein